MSNKQDAHQENKKIPAKDQPQPREEVNGQSFEDLGIDEDALNRAWRQVAEENKSNRSE